MGKAARRRHARRMDHLSKLSHQFPERFDTEWELRMTDWMDTIRYQASKWNQGKTEEWEQVFVIVDRAVEILYACSPAAQRKHMTKTIEMLNHEC
ncbi:uncharacterized protein Dvar_51560 [Desulfosarcina variabilis str. Montpellier]|uniref:hypothetical protein n=1 Tax=Desulfosarcina variabilis TaxID=2300 RepID=UPI003AFB0742